MSNYLSLKSIDEAFSKAPKGEQKTNEDQTKQPMLSVHASLEMGKTTLLTLTADKMCKKHLSLDPVLI